MSSTTSTPKDTKILSEEDLRTLARQHEAILKKFLLRRERELLRRQQDAEVLSLAQQMATAMLYREVSKSVAQKPSAPDAPETLTDGDVKSQPDGNEIVEAKKVSSFIHFNASSKPSEAAKFWRKIGGGGLTASLIFHAALIVFAVFYVVSTYVVPTESPPEFFATGSGGGRGGDRPSYADVQHSRRKNAKIRAGTKSRKIVSKVANSKLALPEIPVMPMADSFAGNVLSAGGMSGLGGALSSGSGGGLGGGVGVGTGIGIGNTRNFIGNFQTTRKILGTNVTAGRLAVYMDSSGSMTDVLPIVRNEILKNFPTADVYEFMGCSMGEMTEISRSRLEQGAWERKKKSLLKSYDREKTPSAARRAYQQAVRKNKKTRKNGVYDFSGGDEWQKYLSSYGKALVSAWSGNEYSSWLALGRWLEMVFTEGGYDSVIVFADFQDYRDGQISDEAGLFERWLRLARANGQRVYFFTTEMLPQNIFRALADYTGGDVAIPKDTAKDSDIAQETEEFLSKTRRGQNLLPTDLELLSAPGKIQFEEEVDYEEFEGEWEDENSEEIVFDEDVEDELLEN